MVLKKFRIKQKDSSGNYDTLHPETSADQVIDQATGKTVASHLVDEVNPHKVTKSQVGLGSVGNFAIATQLEAETGTSDLKYMTPLRVKEAVTKFTPKNVPNGFAGLDGERKLNLDVMPSGTLTKISEINLTANPTNRIQFSGLSKYREIVVIFKDVTRTQTFGGGLTINATVNNIVSPYTAYSLNYIYNTSIATGTAVNIPLNSYAADGTNYTEMAIGKIEFMRGLGNVLYESTFTSYRPNSPSYPSTRKMWGGINTQSSIINSIELFLFPDATFNGGIVEVLGGLA